MGHPLRCVALVAAVACLLSFAAVAQADVRGLEVADPVGDVSCSGTPCPPDVTHATVTFDRASGTIAIVLSFAAPVPATGCLDGGFGLSSTAGRCNIPIPPPNRLTFGLSGTPGSGCSLYAAPAVQLGAYATSSIGTSPYDVVVPTSSGLGPLTVTKAVSSNLMTFGFTVTGPGLVGADLRCFSLGAGSDSIPPTWFPGLAPLPIVSASSATLVTAVSARLAVTIDAQDAMASWHAEIGTTLALGQSSGIGTVYGEGAVPVTVDYSGLAAGTTYYYRFVASSAIGSSATPIASFTTAAITPVPAPHAVAVVGGRPRLIQPPSISRAGRRLTCRVGVWRWSPHLTVRWFAAGRPLSSARSMRLRAADAGKTVRCTVYAQNTFGHADSTASAHVGGTQKRLGQSRV